MSAKLVQLAPGVECLPSLNRCFLSLWLQHAVRTQLCNASEEKKINSNIGKVWNARYSRWMAYKMVFILQEDRRNTRGQQQHQSTGQNRYSCCHGCCMQCSTGQDCNKTQIKIKIYRFIRRSDNVVLALCPAGDWPCDPVLPDWDDSHVTALSVWCSLVGWSHAWPSSHHRKASFFFPVNNARYIDTWLDTWHFIVYSCYTDTLWRHYTLHRHYTDTTHYTDVEYYTDTTQILHTT